MTNSILKAARRKTAVAVGSLATLSFVSPVMASTYADPRTQLEKVGTSSGLVTTELPVVIGKFINQIITLLGIVLVVLIIWAGFKWMLARGNEEDVNEAKDIIKNAVIGLVLLLTAYAITNFVINAILTGTGTTGA
ncbi:MAG: pilin [Patescibacteria group bacterium]|nr:pilin [Patescibacteria group bacterium]